MNDNARVNDIAAAVVALAPALHRALERRADAEFEHPRPPEMQLSALRLVRRRPGTTVRELAGELQLKPNNASALVTAMVAGGLLLKEHDQADRRVVRLRLTDQARERHDAVQALFTGYVEAALTTLTDRERRDVAAALPVLSRLAEQIKQGE
ncbi:MarR family transcriptional regulator [Paractinoplanes deccanensis]|uniref:MarR family transcriptional regulator n=1 Tax=Paractinoplanes deccanensis TaxID=113561 RepID=A0ABQ3Y3L4_9ACTN|nr:MarR family transcriptional regulator [Actinoplanes deccanensis]GID74553.1 MarR family transcriptional regulator [Actinoplanes deccanensis]